jgi:hypothetical protein
VAVGVEAPAFTVTDNTSVIPGYGSGGSPVAKVAVTSSVPAGRAEVAQAAVPSEPTVTSLQSVVAPKVKVSVPPASVRGRLAVRVTDCPAVTVSEVAVAQ